MRIFSDGDEWGIGVNEKEVLVDDYIEKYTFIRYSCEGEREEYLKVILEKKNQEYFERFARTVKAKGDDCAVSETNEKLERLEFPERESVLQEEQLAFDGMLDAFLEREFRKTGLNLHAISEFFAMSQKLEDMKMKKVSVPLEVSEVGKMTAELHHLLMKLPVKVLGKLCRDW